MYSQMFHAFSVLVQQELSPVDEQSLVAQAGLLLQSAKNNNMSDVYNYSIQYALLLQIRLLLQTAADISTLSTNSDA